MTRVDSDTRVRAHFERVCAAGLEEDLGGGGAELDVTTTAVVPAGLRGTAEVVAVAPGVVCGLAALEATFDLLDSGVAVVALAADGDDAGAGDVVARATGAVRPLLTGERTALNVLSRLSGIATLTRAFVRAAPGVEIADTRKTTPSWRALEKYAVRTGGGTNHRLALWDAVLVKDNHVRAAGSLGEAVRRVRAATTLPVQAECDSLDELAEAMEAGADAVLLDNFDVEAVREAVRRVRASDRPVAVEVSGGVTLDTVAAYAAAGPDRISIGALTHSAPALDLSFRLV